MANVGVKFSYQVTFRTDIIEEAETQASNYLDRKKNDKFIVPWSPNYHFILNAF